MPRSNIYEAGAASVAELFDGYIESVPENGMCIVLAMSTRPLETEARNAIEKSFDALGYGKNACTYTTLYPKEAAGSSSQEDQPDQAQTGGGVELDSQALFLLIEGLDPICIVATDENAVRALGRTYRSEYPADSAIRVFGRSSVAFRNLSALLESDSGKQKAWRLFKSIPRR